jgi:Methyltransferase domain
MTSVNDIETVIAQIAALPADWHKAGMVSRNVLRTIARYATEIGPIRRSVETGAGKTTLLFSHLSANHTFFAIDLGDSIRAVRNSPLFNSATTTLVEGPTQRTLPAYTFTEKVQIALIDGPHGYPFPDLEYYYLYQQIAENGLLLMDDIKIPSIRRMFDIVRAEAMFQLLEVVDNNMAFFRRTAAPLIDPEGDNWWLQGYNLSYYEKLTRVAAIRQRLPGWCQRLAAWGKNAVRRG